MTRKAFLCVGAVFMMNAYLAAQVYTNFNNSAIIGEAGHFQMQYHRSIDFEIPEKDIEQLLENERARHIENGVEGPYYFAEPVSADLNIPQKIRWVESEGIAYGRFDIRANKALSISINFDKFFLPDNTEMYIYNKDGKMITGPITEKENNENKVWGSWVYQGESLTIEIKTPGSTRHHLQLHSNNIAYGYKELYKSEASSDEFGDSESCNINIICPLGSGWESERNSVAMILNTPGSAFCSGAMVMNSCATRRPFFLTANHCFKPGDNPATWRFTFHRWSSSCPHPGIDTAGLTFQGATVKANYSSSDFLLLELEQTPQPNSNVSYAGWNRNTTGISQTTIIHHPDGDVMKITRDNNAPVFGSYLGAQSWRLDVDQGATEIGSSGGPYFDQNHRIIGQHHGVPDESVPVCSSRVKYGGRFDVSWNGGGTSSTRLSSWLAPTNPMMTTNTTNVANLATYTKNPALVGPSVICGSGATYSLTGVSSVANIAWTQQGPFTSGYLQLPLQNVASVPSSGNPITVSRLGIGNIRLIATVTDCDGTVSIFSKDIALGVPPASNNGYYQNAPGSNRVITGTASPTVATYIPIALVHANNTYTWSRSSGSPNATYSVSGPTGSNASVTFNRPVQYNNQISFNVSTFNACGTRSDPLTILYQGPNMFIVSPNPASTEISIEPVPSAVNASGETPVASFSRIQTLDKVGNVMIDRRLSNSTARARINTLSLRPGYYIVKIYHSSQAEEHPLMIIR